MQHDEMFNDKMTLRGSLKPPVIINARSDVDFMNQMMPIIMIAEPK